MRERSRTQRGMGGRVSPLVSRFPATTTAERCRVTPPRFSRSRAVSLTVTPLQMRRQILDDRNHASTGRHEHHYCARFASVHLGDSSFRISRSA